MKSGVAWRPVLIVAAIAAVVHLTVATRYGWHRDELYYVIAGQHPAFGYADQPPLTPLLAALAGNLLVLRLLAIIAQVGCVVLTAVLTAQFGGSARAQAIAAGCVAASPVFIGAALLFGTTVIDQVVWVAVFVTTVRALRLGTISSWLIVGLIAGIGLENKDTVVVLVAGIGVGLLLYRRDVLRTPGPWLAVGVALVLAAPNFIWDAANGWPEFQMASAIAGKQGGILGALLQLPLGVLAAGPILIGVWVAGIRWLAGSDHRWLLAVGVFAVVVFTFSGGKYYYEAAMLAALFAAGAVRIADSRRWPAWIAVSGVIGALITLPFLPAAVMSWSQKADPEPLETYGWPEFVSQVGAAEHRLPAGTPIFTSNYSEASAMTLLGGYHNVYSGHNAYWNWGPPPGTPTTVLCVGEFQPDYLKQFWSVVEPIGPITLPDGIRNKEIAAHATMYRCERPKGSWAQLWPSMRHLD